MKEKLVLVIEDGKHVLYTESGERLNRLYSSVVFQDCNPGTVHVLTGVHIDISEAAKKYFPPCSYSDGKLFSPSGKELDVEIRRFETIDNEWSSCWFYCHVELSDKTPGNDK